MGQKAAVRVSSFVVLTLVLVVVVLLIAVRPGSALDEAPLPPIGGDVQSVDTEGFYASYRCTYDSMKIDDAGLISDIEIATIVLTDDDGAIIDELHMRYSWADGRMMIQIIESGLEPMPLESLDDQRRTGLDMVSPDPWLPLDGSSYVLLEGWSADGNNSPYAVDLETYSDLVIEPAPVTTLEEHGWVWNVVPYVGGYSYTRDEVDDDGGPTRTTKERIGFSYTAWYHEGTGLLLAADSAQERFVFETNYERHHSSGRVVVHPLGVLYSHQCVLVDTNLNLGAPPPDVPAAGVLPDGEEPGDDGEAVVGEGPVTDTDETGTDGEDGSGDEEVDPAAQAAAAGATALLAGGWLIAETVSGRRRRDESDAGTVPLAPTGPVPSDMVPTEEDRYWDERNRMERAAALRAHQQFADDQWGKFTDRCRDRAAADRAAAAAERHDRQLRRTAADRLEDMATDKGYRDFVSFMDRQLEAGTLPSWHQLEEMRNGIVKRVGDQAAIDKYYEKSDVRTFLEGCQDTAARGVGKVVRTAHGSVAGRGAEWLVRNPGVPLRIGLAAGTGGYSELVLLPVDAWDAMEAAADRKMAEQNRELTYWEATKEIIKTGAWHVGGELVGDGISKISQMRGGGVAAGREAAEEAADVAARRASRRAGAQTGDDFVRRVKARLPEQQAARVAREAEEAAARKAAGRALTPDELIELRKAEHLKRVAPRRAAEIDRSTIRAALADGRPPPDARALKAAREAVEKGEVLVRAPKNWVAENALPGEVIPRNHLHETGLTARQAEAAGRICADEEVVFTVRTINMDSMADIRNGTGVPKGVFVKPKTINEIDTYLGATRRGKVGLFEPVMPDPDTVPPELLERILKRFDERSVEFKKMKTDPVFQKSLRDGVSEVKDGVVYNVPTGQPYVGDPDLGFVQDAPTKKFLTSGDRYERVMQRYRTDVGGQHGGEMTIVHDLTSGRGLRPGTPDYAEAHEGAVALRNKLQSAYLKGEVAVEIHADGVLRRGPVGADINLTPSADEILVDVAESAPAAGSPGPIGGAVASGPPQGTGGAVGSTIGREFEETPDA